MESAELIAGHHDEFAIPIGNGYAKPVAGVGSGAITTSAFTLTPRQWRALKRRGLRIGEGDGRELPIGLALFGDGEDIEPSSPMKRSKSMAPVP